MGGERTETQWGGGGGVMTNNGRELAGDKGQIKSVVVDGDWMDREEKQGVNEAN